MPRLLNPYPSQTKPTPTSLLNVRYRYSYPLGLDLRPGSDMHEFLKGEIMARANESHEAMSNRYESWNKIDETLTSYIPLSDVEENMALDDETKPVSMVVPLSYAAIETLLSYLTIAFLEEPIFQYEGFTDEDMIGAILIEKLVELQTRKSGAGIQLHTVFRDALAYGFGAATPIWTQRMGWRRQKRQQGVFSTFLNRFTGFEDVVERVEEIKFEGNELHNIDPYNYLPDVNHPIQDVQKGEYVGWLNHENRMELLSREAYDENTFNAKYLRHIDGRSTLGIDESERDRFDVSSGMENTSNSTDRMDTIYMYIDLIPNEWKSQGDKGPALGRSKYPEKWAFGLTGDQVITSAHPLELDHNMFPIVTCAPEYDGYTITPISKMEVVYGLQKLINFLYNCYDKETEVLTSRGWVPFPQLEEDDEVSAVDPVTLEFWFEKPKQMFEYDYDGYLVQFLSSRMDICVTPNHNMFVRKRYRGDWEFKPAALVGRDSASDYKTIGNLNWKGEINPPSIRVESRGERRKDKPVEIPAYWMAEFLGWFVSEGSISHGEASGSYSVSIKQKKDENLDDIDFLMSGSPVHVTRCYHEGKDAFSWTITHRGFYEWLKENCYSGGTHSEHKKVPNFIKEWDIFHLELFFGCAMRGDGSWMDSHPNLGQYSSTSKQLIDDMQEISLRLGYFSHVYLGEIGENAYGTAGKPFHRLNISTSSTFPTIAQRNCFKYKYEGKVYCFENSTHLTITRRHGKIAIQGQSHVQNVRKAIHDMFLVDPMAVNVNDLLTPKPGKIIRTRRQAWGKGVANLMEQLKVTDVTSNHLRESGVISQILDRVSGAEDALQGGVGSKKERVSASEFQGRQSAALNRMEKHAMIIGLQALNPLSEMYASHTQQFMTQEQYVSIVGEHEEVLRREFGDAQERAMVGPMDILIKYNVVSHSGTLPTSGDPQAWLAMMQMIGGNPALMERFDVVRIFKHWARLSGAKNLHRFEKKMDSLQPTVMQDEEVASEVQKGNLVSMEEAIGR